MRKRCGISSLTWVIAAVSRVWRNSSSQALAEPIDAGAAEGDRSRPLQKAEEFELLTDWLKTYQMTNDGSAEASLCLYDSRQRHRIRRLRVRDFRYPTLREQWLGNARLVPGRSGSRPHRARTSYMDPCRLNSQASGRGGDPSLASTEDGWPHSGLRAPRRT